MKYLKLKVGAGLLAAVAATSAIAFALFNSNEPVMDTAVEILDSLVPTSFGGDIYDMYPPYWTLLCPVKRVHITLGSILFFNNYLVESLRIKSVSEYVIL